MTTTANIQFWSGIQGATGLVFAGFATAHMANTACAALGANAFNGVQDALRQVYQHPVVEITLLAAVLMHIVAGVVKKFTHEAQKREAEAAHAQRKKAAATKARLWLSRKTAHSVGGYVLLSLVLIHAAENRAFLPEGVRLHFNALAHSMHRLKGGFFPFYVALAVAATVHMLLGIPIACVYVHHWLGAFPVVRKVPTVVVAFAAAAVVAGVCAMAGVFQPVAIDMADPAVAAFDKEMWAFRNTSMWRDYV